MSQASLDVVGIGNAIVDVIAHADDASSKPTAWKRAP